MRPPVGDQWDNELQYLCRCKPVFLQQLHDVCRLRVLEQVCNFTCRQFPVGQFFLNFLFHTVPVLVELRGRQTLLSFHRAQ